MPGQGSPKTLSDAVSVHDPELSQMVVTIENEFASLQLRSCMAGFGQSFSPDVIRPKLAYSMCSLVPGQLSVAELPSQVTLYMTYRSKNIHFKIIDII